MVLKFFSFLLSVILSTAYAATTASALTHEELNAEIECLTHKFEDALEHGERRNAWAQISRTVNDHADFSKYINCVTPGTADIKTPFAVVMDGVDFGADYREETRKGMDVDIVVLRGDPRDLTLHTIPVQHAAGIYSISSLAGARTRDEIAQAKDVSLADLYGEFEDQKGRAENIGKYTRQDLKPIATHFVLVVKGRPVARIQVQISEDHSVELNYEENFPDTPKQTPSGMRRSEVGRNGLLRTTKMPVDVLEEIEAGGGEEHLKNLMFQKVFSWINSDVQLPEVRFHVNGAVRRNWMRTFKPVKFDQELVLQNNPSPAKVEWLITFKRESLIKLEERTFAKGLLDNLEKVSRDTAASSKVLFYLRANEIEVLKRIGIADGALIRPKSPGPTLSDGTYAASKYGGISINTTNDSYSITLRVDRDKINDLETYLKNFLEVKNSAQ